MSMSTVTCRPAHPLIQQPVVVADYHASAVTLHNGLPLFRQPNGGPDWHLGTVACAVFGPLLQFPTVFLGLS